MSNLKVLWSPSRDDQFLTYGNAINLYRVGTFKNDQSLKGQQVIKLSDEKYAVHLSVNTEIPITKCVSWYPKKDPENLLAVGQANGKVVLTSFGATGNIDLVGKEFIPKHTRQCNYLVWNPVDCDLLAEGLEKYRGDASIAIWHIMAKQNSELSTPPERQRYSSTMSDLGAITKPYIELGTSDISSSFSWFHTDPHTFVAGMGNKYLKIYDLRDISRPHVVTQTRSVYGVCADPRSINRIASFTDNQVSVWDMRSFERPILTLQEFRSVIKIDWCSTRMGFLAVLCKDSSAIKVYDTRLVGTEELEPAIIERTVSPPGSNVLSCFAWHPTHENRLMTVTPTGVLRDVTVYERIPLIWSPDFHLTWGCGKKLINFVPSDDCTEEDISIKMKNRAIRGYGLHTKYVWHNAEITKEPRLYGLWNWLAAAKSLIKEDTKEVKKTPSKNNVSNYMGVKAILNLDHVEGNSKSDMVYSSWQGPEGSTYNTKIVTQYQSTDRSHALQLCGWAGSHDNRDQLESLLIGLQDEGEYARAAAIALFNLKIGMAIEILSSNADAADVRDADPNLNTVAMALSGYTEEHNALWRITCGLLYSQLRDPYLKVMFAFLTGDRESFDDVLQKDEECCIDVKDRVAFACIYLPDNKLLEFIEETTRKLKHQGDLDGILMTGLTYEGIDLLERYVDLTCDVQTAALACIHTFPSEVSKDLRVISWMQNYSSLLDRWRLWHQRARFDIICHISDMNTRIPTQAFVSCNFCGKSIACNLPLASRPRPFASPLMSAHKPKISCCPGCRKPLPRCAVCLTNLGTMSGSAVYLQKETTNFDHKMSPFKDWFTWCQTCRHGGHSSHITDWFKEHKDCPVTGCSCKCMTLDPIGRLNAKGKVAMEPS